MPETTQPDGTEWVVVKHVRFPIPEDTVIGHYATVADAQLAFNTLLANPQWFCRYSVEHRNKS